MKRRNPILLAIPLLVASAIGLVSAEEPGDSSVRKSVPQVRTELAPAGAKAFLDVARVLQSPRCMNCHPAGDAPLQTDASTPHKMNITRLSEESGLQCSACHQQQNSEALGIAGGPPGAPNWHLPPRETPMVFQGLSPRELCEQLRDPARNGNKSLEQLLEHVSSDALVLWGWNPGGERTKPPMAHAEFVKRFDVWVKSGGACPK